MNYVPFLDDEIFIGIVNEVFIKGVDAKSKSIKGFNRNVIDPFAALFEIACLHGEFDNWFVSEASRQAQKSLANHVGAFHQKILGSVIGWKDLETGGMVDVENQERKIIAEIKNKYNTLKGSNQIDLYQELESYVMRNGQKYKGYTAYYVEIIPKKPVRYDVPFTPSDKKTSSKCASNELIRIIDGASFYSLVTGHENALHLVFEALPSIFKKINPSLSINGIESLQDFFRKAYIPKAK
jgi:hypothetical protein